MGRFEHTPLMQVLSGGQVFAQVPQLNSSMLTSTQVPLQKARSAGHKHFPLRHVFPRGQIFPHEPQFSRSTLVSLQVPLQRIVPAGQVGLLGATAEAPLIPVARSTRMYVILQIIVVKFISYLISYGHPHFGTAPIRFQMVLLAIHLF